MFPDGRWCRSDLIGRMVLLGWVQTAGSLECTIGVLRRTIGFALFARTCDILSWEFCNLSIGCESVGVMGIFPR